MSTPGSTSGSPRDAKRAAPSSSIDNRPNSGQGGQAASSPKRLKQGRDPRLDAAIRRRLGQSPPRMPLIPLNRPSLYAREGLQEYYRLNSDTTKEHETQEKFQPQTEERSGHNIEIQTQGQTSQPDRVQELSEAGLIQNNSEHNMDSEARWAALRMHLDAAEKEARAFKDKITQLQARNDELVAENSLLKNHLASIVKRIGELDVL